MPNNSGNYPIHQVIGKHNADNCYELEDILEKKRFITIEEFYHSEKLNEDGLPLKSKGPITLQIGDVKKVKKWYSKEENR